MPRRTELSPREQAFVDEYLIDGVGARSARAAGYSARSATKTAWDLVRKPHIKAAIKKALDAQQKRTLITADKVLLDIDRIAAKAEGKGEFNAALYGKIALAKHYKLLTDKHEHTGKNGGPMEFTEVRRTIVDPKAAEE